MDESKEDSSGEPTTDEKRRWFESNIPRPPEGRRQPPIETSDEQKLNEAKRVIDAIAAQARQQLGQATPTQPIEIARQLATKSKSMRQEYEGERKAGRIKRWLIKKAAQGASRVFIGGTLEAPIFFGYGVGDGIALLNGLTGRDIYTGGDRIDPVQRGIYIVGAAVPGIPASIIVEGAELVRFGFESTFSQNQRK